MKRQLSEFNHYSLIIPVLIIFCLEDNSGVTDSDLEKYIASYFSGSDFPVDQDFLANTDYLEKAKEALIVTGHITRNAVTGAWSLHRPELLINCAPAFPTDSGDFDLETESANRLMERYCGMEPNRQSDFVKELYRAKRLDVLRHILLDKIAFAVSDMKERGEAASTRVDYICGLLDAAAAIGFIEDGFSNVDHPLCLAKEMRKLFREMEARNGETATQS